MFVKLIMELAFVMVAAYCAAHIIASWRMLTWRRRCVSTALVVLLLAMALDGVVTKLSVLQLGGMAKWGKIDGGKFFVGNHGQYTEVTDAVFRRNLWYGRVAGGLEAVSIVGFLAALLASGLIRRGRFDWSVASIINPDAENKDLK